MKPLAQDLMADKRLRCSMRRQDRSVEEKSGLKRSQGVPEASWGLKLEQPFLLMLVANTSYLQAMPDGAGTQSWVHESSL